MGLLVGFLPWIVFAILRAFGFLAPALLVALACSVYTVASAPRRAKVLDWTSLTFFTILALLVLVAGQRELLLWTSTLSNGTLAAVAWGGLLVGRPLTVPYAKEHVPPKFWDRPDFLKVNRVLTVVWAVGFTVDAVTAYFLFEGLVTDWVDEAVSLLSMVVAMHFTAEYPVWYRRRAPADEGPDVPPSSRG